MADEMQQCRSCSLPWWLLTLLLLLLLATEAALARPADSSEERFGSWGSFSGLGGSLGGSFSGSFGSNLGLGFSSRGATGGRDYGLNVNSAHSGSLAGNGHLNLGIYSGGYRHPVGYGPQPGAGPGGFPGMQPGFPQQPPGFGPQQPGAGQQPQPGGQVPYVPQPAGPQNPVKGDSSNSVESTESKEPDLEFGSPEFELPQDRSSESREVAIAGVGIINPRAQIKQGRRARFFEKIRNWFG